MNDLKTFDFEEFGSQMVGLSAPSLTKEIEVTDSKWNPLPNVHFKWGTSGVISNHEGIATVTVPTEDTVVTITHVGKRTHQAKFKDLGYLITLQDQEQGLPPVVVGAPKPQQISKNGNGLKIAAFGFGILLLLGMMANKKDKPSLKAPSTKKPKKAKKKAKKAKKKGLREPFIETIEI